MWSVITLLEKININLQEMNEGKTNLFGYQGVCIHFRFSREKQDGVMTSDLNNNLFVIFAQGPTGKAGNTLCYFVLNPIVFRCFKSPIDIQFYIYIYLF